MNRTFSIATTSYYLAFQIIFNEKSLFTSAIINGNTMDAAFFTTTSKLTIKNGTIWEKHLVDREKTYWLHSFIILLFLIGDFLYTAINESARYWLYVLLGLVWIAPHLKKIYQLVFTKAWRWYIPLSEIKSVEMDLNFNELEQRVVLTLKTGREKAYLFRKLEHQAETFTELVLSRVPGTFLQTV